MQRTNYIVRDLLKLKKLGPIHSVTPYESVETALRKMADHDVGAILVIDNGKIEGVFSERDYARKLLLRGKSEIKTPVHQVMKRDVVYVTPNYFLEDCLALMMERHIRHLPVIEDDKVLALISIEHVVETLLEGKEFLINELTQYVTGSLVPFVDKHQGGVRERILKPVSTLTNSAENPNSQYGKTI